MYLKACAITWAIQPSDAKSTALIRSRTLINKNADLKYRHLAVNEAINLML